MYILPDPLTTNIAQSLHIRQLILPGRVVVSKTKVTGPCRPKTLCQSSKQHLLALELRQATGERHDPKKTFLGEFSRPPFHINTQYKNLSLSPQWRGLLLDSPTSPAVCL